MDTLKVGIFQMNIHWKNPDRNILEIENKLNSIQESLDLFILPEMFTTGFSMDAEHLAWNENHRQFLEMKQLAISHSCSIVGSVWFRENKKYYNRCFHWNKHGTIEHYDKVHLFTLVDEDIKITSGEDQKIFNINGWKIKPQVCYDLRFPKESYNDKNKPYDLLVYIANWPEKRITAWKNLLAARAIENQSLTIGVNRIGLEPKGINYTGQSMVFNYLGEPILPLPKNREGLFIFTLSKKHQNEFRYRFPFIKDA